LPIDRAYVQEFGLDLANEQEPEPGVKRHDVDEAAPAPAADLDLGRNEEASAREAPGGGRDAPCVSGVADWSILDPRRHEAKVWLDSERSEDAIHRPDR
jgi:hypothetical protein